jgi:hypothetical protein
MNRPMHAGNFFRPRPFPVRPSIAAALLVSLGLLIAADDADAESKCQAWSDASSRWDGERSDSNVLVCSSIDDCKRKLEEYAKTYGSTRTTGYSHFSFQSSMRCDFVKPAPAPTCASVPKPLDDTRTAQCPVGTVGTFGQTRAHVSDPRQVYPDQCWMDGPESAWAPQSSPLCVVPPTSTVQFRYSKFSNAGPYANLDGATISGPVQIRLGIDCAVTPRMHVEFFLDGVARWTQENECPFVYMGDDALNTFSAGSHVLEARYDGKVSRASFTAGSTTPNPPDPTDPTIEKGTATIRWTTPTENVDRTPLEDLAGYRIVFGRSPDQLTGSVDVGIVNEHKVTGLAAGTWYFSVMALAKDNKSRPSNIVSGDVP